MIEIEIEILSSIVLAFAIICCVGMYLVTHWTQPPQRGLNVDVDIHGSPEPDIYREIADRIRFYTTPSDPSKCRNLVKDGPTPCWHPHCDCMTTDHTQPRPRLGHEEILRRHLYQTGKDSKRVSPRSKT